MSPLPMHTRLRMHPLGKVAHARHAYPHMTHTTHLPCHHGAPLRHRAGMAHGIACHAHPIKVGAGPHPLMRSPIGHAVRRRGRVVASSTHAIERHLGMLGVYLVRKGMV